MSAGRTIRDAVAIALEGLSGVSGEWAWHRNDREPVRAYVVRWVHEYARQRGVILSDSDIVTEFDAIVRELRERAS